MKIYVLMNENNNNFENICIDKDILKIKTSICKDLNQKKDYPKLEIWKDGKKIEEIFGSDVLKIVAREINLKEN